MNRTIMYRYLPGLVVSLLMTATVWAADPDPERERQLVSLLVHDCGSCHGTRLNGGLGPPLTAVALQQRTLDWITWIILNGSNGSAMPPWRALLTPHEATWIAAALKSGKVTGGK